MVLVEHRTNLLASSLSETLYNQFCHGAVKILPGILSTLALRIAAAYENIRMQSCIMHDQRTRPARPPDNNGPRSQLSINNNPSTYNSIPLKNLTSITLPPLSAPKTFKPENSTLSSIIDLTNCPRNRHVRIDSL